MSQEDDNVNYVHIGVRAYTSRMVGSFMLGASLVGAGQGYINSVTSVEVAVQHGEEIQKLRDDLADLERETVRAMADRWTRADHNEYSRQHQEQESAQDRRIQSLERVIDNL